ncbi:hypothetical protein [Pectobacterium phage Wc4-1]|uniref:Uncharacterized protein n=1 Tax=Pectobacterium phage Wc4 TaxID=2652428 RepID=A0A5P8D495_9CAUD|nr:hypothetical protein [Pectobacterium phage Wc4]QFP93958.1 hypothetical protein [Pectobacterium phage Wc4-1]
MLEKGCIAFIVAMVILLVWALIVDHAEMKAQHCKPTSQTRIEIVLMSVSNGNGGTMLIPTPVEERLYTCDDFPRWR